MGAARRGNSSRGPRVHRRQARRGARRPRLREKEPDRRSGHRRSRALQAADVDDAVAAARAAFEAGAGAARIRRQRKRVLHALRRAHPRDLERLALLETLDVGKPILNSLNVDVPLAADSIAYYAEFADKLYDEVAPTGPDDLALIRREPLGVVAAVVPWNYPLIIAPGSSDRRCSPAIPSCSSPPSSRRSRAIRLGELGRRGGLAAGRAQRRARLRRGGGQAARAARRRRHGELHRLDRSRQADAALCRRIEHEARRRSSAAARVRTW